MNKSSQAKPALLHAASFLVTSHVPVSRVPRVRGSRPDRKQELCVESPDGRPAVCKNVEEAEGFSFLRIFLRLF